MIATLRRTRLARRGRIALVLLVLPLALVFSTPVTASALVAPPAPVSIGPALKTVPVGAAVKGAGRSIPLVRTGMALLSLYSVADTVLDLPGGEPNAGNDPAVDGSTRTLTACQVSISGVSFDGRTVTGTSTWTGCSSSSATQIDWAVVNCRSTAAQASPRFLTGNSGAQSAASRPSGADWSSGSSTFPPLTVCPSGTTIQGIAARARITGSTPSTSPTISLGNPYPDGDYQQTTSVQCRKADGTLVTITESLTGYPGKVVIPSCTDRVPGSIPWGVTAKGGPDGGTSETLLEITPDRDLLTKYPDCFSGGALTCVVRVFVGGQPCVFGMPGCVNWREDLDNGTDGITCRFGSYVVPITTCGPLRKSYRKKQPGVATGSGPASDPEVKYPTDPADYPEPGSQPNSSPNPSANPSNPTNPQPTTGTNPETDSGPGTDPTGQPEGSNSSCWGTGWSWNPVSWVVIPVKCSLKWAFVPRQTTMTNIGTDLRAKWNASTPGLWVNAVGDLVPTGSVSGCKGPHVDLRPVVPVHFYPLDACTGTAAMVAGVSKTVATVFVIAGGFFASLRGIGAGLGWQPGVGEKL